MQLISTHTRPINSSPGVRGRGLGAAARWEAHSKEAGPVRCAGRNEMPRRKMEKETVQGKEVGRKASSDEVQ